jgi:hypothetical protein
MSPKPALSISLTFRQITSYRSAGVVIDEVDGKTVTVQPQAQADLARSATMDAEHQESAEDMRMVIESRGVVLRGFLLLTGTADLLALAYF